MGKSYDPRDDPFSDLYMKWQIAEIWCNPHDPDFTEKRIEILGIDEVLIRDFMLLYHIVEGKKISYLKAKQRVQNKINRRIWYKYLFHGIRQSTVGCNCDG